MRTLHNLHTIDESPGQVGVTARKGSKWADLQLQEVIELCVCLEGQHNVVGHGKVEEVWSGWFKYIPARFIEFEHEKSSRVYTGLLESMRRAYGAEFSEQELVTVIQYSRMD